MLLLSSRPARLPKAKALGQPAARKDGIHRVAENPALQTLGCEGTGLWHALVPISRRAACSREDRHHLHVSTAAFRADEVPLLRHVNEDHVVPELQLLECLNRLMMAPLAEAMHDEGGFAAGSCVSDRLRAARASRVGERCIP